MQTETMSARIQRQLRIRTVKRGSGEVTEVTLKAVHVPELSSGAGAPRWLLTTERRSRLSPALFDRQIAAKIHEASSTKGRAIYAVDLRLNDVVAAAAYHIPADGDQVLITGLAPRTDAAAASGRACVLMLKACIHEIAAALGRGSQLGLRTGGASADEAVRLYGFRRGPRGKGRPASLFVQDAVALDELSPRSR